MTKMASNNHSVLPYSRELSACTHARSFAALTHQASRTIGSYTSYQIVPPQALVTPGGGLRLSTQSIICSVLTSSHSQGSRTLEGVNLDPLRMRWEATTGLTQQRRTLTWTTPKVLSRHILTRRSLCMTKLNNS